MPTNEENARDIVFQCLVEHNDGRPMNPTRLANRIIACLAEVQLIAEDVPTGIKLYDAYKAFHGIADTHAHYDITAGKVSVHGEVVTDPDYVIPYDRGFVVQSACNRCYASFVV